MARNLEIEELVLRNVGFAETSDEKIRSVLVEQLRDDSLSDANALAGLTRAEFRLRAVDRNASSRRYGWRPWRSTVRAASERG
jgi:hypothetical protein